MAAINNLHSSWNFDTVSGSDAYGSFIVKDTINSNYGTGDSFGSNTSNFINKEILTTNKKIYIDTIESDQTIQIIDDEDDSRIDKFHKPSKIQLMVENSMYQIISDEMLNLFSSIDNLSFKFNEPYNKYRDNYPELESSRNFFFSKILEKPNLEKYIEYYKWLDSSLGDMIEQLIPESANSSHGLKNTVESHILERNKYKHQLPLVIEQNNIFSDIISVVTTDNFIGTRSNSSSYDAKRHRKDNIYYTQDRIKSVYHIDVSTTEDIKNILNKNFKKNHQVIQTSENNLKNRENGSDSVFLTKFSSGDGLSENNRSTDQKYSVYNTVNNRALNLKNAYNEKLSKKTPYAATSSYDNLIFGKQGDNDRIVTGALNLSYNTSNFIDNSHVQRNIPYAEKNYHSASNSNIFGSDLNNTLYLKVPHQKILDTFRYKNIIIEKDTESYETSTAIVEPPITYNIPVKHMLALPNSTQQVEIYSPLNTITDFFSQKNLNKENNFLINSLSGSFIPNKIENTFWYLAKTQNSFNISKTEILNTIFPRKDLIGLSRIRTKANQWLETNSTGRLLDPYLQYYKPTINNGKEEYKNLPYALNSTANNPTKILTFWKRDLPNRIRLTVQDYFYRGAHNSLNFPLTKENFIKTSSASLKTFSGSYDCSDCNSYENISITCSYDSSPLLSLYSMDGFVEYKLTGSQDSIQLSCNKEIYGELAPYSHLYAVKFTKQTHKIDILNTINKIHVDTLYNNPRPYPEKKTISIENNDYRPLAKPVFVQNNFFPPYLTYTSGTDLKQDLNIILNKSYQVGIDCRIKPFYDSLVEYEGNIRHKSQQYSIVPEFIVSKNYKLIEDDAAPVDYNYTKFLNKNDDIEYDDYIVDLNKFIDKKSNKIKIKLNAIKKLIPYNNFYPQQQTTKVANLFAEEYLENTGFATKGNKYGDIGVLTYIDYTTNPKRSVLTYNPLIAAHRTLSIMQPLFMPGILFNSIKSGLAVSWAAAPMFYDSDKKNYVINPGLFTTSSAEDHLDHILNTKENVNWGNIYADERYKHNMYSIDFTDCYAVTGCYQLSPTHAPVVRNITYKLPFETLLEPEFYYANMLDYVATKYSGSTLYGNIALNYNYVYDKSDFVDGFTKERVILPYLDPSAYSAFLGGTIDEIKEKNLIKTNLLQFIKSLESATFKKYKSAINNFLAETSNFFLKNQKNTEFISAPEQEFNEAVSGTIYSMNIVLAKNQTFSMFNKYPTVNSEDTRFYYVTENSLFGPPVNIDTYKLAQSGPALGPAPIMIPNTSYAPHEKYFSPESYYPYTPPYYQDEGISKFKVSYRAKSDGKPDLKNIIENLFFVPIEYINNPNSYFGDETKSEAFNKKMLVKDCINLNIIRNLNTKEYNPETGRRLMDQVEYGNSWVIQTKFETPIFNFNNCSLYQSGSILDGTVSDAKEFYEMFASSSV